tara:strand:- start:2755 stop:3759 length:1005 start_codon:yes stop_codon:yes gene_type:complete
LHALKKINNPTSGQIPAPYHNMAYQYFLVARVGGRVVAMLSWLGLDICQTSESLSKKQQEFLRWLQEHSPDAVHWGVEGEEVRDETTAGYAEVHQVGGVQAKAIELGLVDKSGIAKMANIMNCKSKCLEGGEWVEVSREEVVKTYPRLEWSAGRLVVVEKPSRPKESKKRGASAVAPAVASVAVPRKKRKTGTVGKVTPFLDSSVAMSEATRWEKYNKRHHVFANMKTADFVGAKHGEDIPVTIYAMKYGKEQVIPEGNIVRKCEEGFFRVVATTFQERTTNAKGVICLPTGGYQTRAGVVFAHFEDTQRKVLAFNGLPPVGCVFSFDDLPLDK